MRVAAGMETFGASEPLKELQKKFGLIPENIVVAAKEQIAKNEVNYETSHHPRPL